MTVLALLPLLIPVLTVLATRAATRDPRGGKR